jgi:hypothetical protein
MLGRRWNYKSAVLSALMRASIFFSTNLTAGLDAATGAALAELVLRFTTSGFYGAITQAFRRVEPQATATLVAMLLLPTLAHSLEWLVHWARGTPALVTSIGVSVAFTVVSTAFNLFAMRHGVLIVGDESRSVWHDLASIPRLIALFIGSAARSFSRACL